MLILSSVMSKPASFKTLLKKIKVTTVKPSAASKIYQTKNKMYANLK